MRELVQKHRLEYEDETEFVSSILGEISMVKNTGVSIEHYYSTNCAENIFRRIYGEYHEYLHQHKPVSYTHLDVYKRQDLHSNCICISRLCAGGTKASCTGATSGEKEVCESSGG